MACKLSRVKLSFWSKGKSYFESSTKRYILTTETVLPQLHPKNHEISRDMIRKKIKPCKFYFHAKHLTRHIL